MATGFEQLLSLIHIDVYKRQIPARPHADDSAGSTVISGDEEDSTESERRHQPELSRVKPVEKKAPIDNEFEFDLPDDAEDDTCLLYTSRCV